MADASRVTNSQDQQPADGSGEMLEFTGELATSPILQDTPPPARESPCQGPMGNGVPEMVKKVSLENSAPKINGHHQARITSPEPVCGSGEMLKFKGKLEDLLRRQDPPPPPSEPANRKNKCRRVPDMLKKMTPDDFNPKVFHLGLLNPRPWLDESEALKRDLVMAYIRDMKANTGTESGDRLWQKCKSSIVVPESGEQAQNSETQGGGHKSQSEGGDPSSVPQGRVNQIDDSRDLRLLDEEATSRSEQEDSSLQDTEMGKELDNDRLTIDALALVASYDVRAESSLRGKFSTNFYTDHGKKIEEFLNMDILLMENQFSLELLKNIYNLIKKEKVVRYGEKTGEKLFSDMLELLIWRLLPFPFLAKKGCFEWILNWLGWMRNDHIVDDKDDWSEWYRRREKLNDRPHLLDCMYEVICSKPDNVLSFLSRCCSGWDRVCSLTNILRYYTQHNVGPSSKLSSEVLPTDSVVRYGILQPRLPSATRLKKVGIVVKPEARTLSEIRYNSRNWVTMWLWKAELIVPVIYMSEPTVRLLRNVAVYEQLEKGSSEHTLITYLQMMSALVESDEDASLLCKTGVIRYRGSDKQLVEAWRVIVSGLEIQPLHARYREVYNQVNARYYTKWPGFWFQYRHDTCSNPCVLWGFIIFTLITLCIFLQSHLALVRASDEHQLWYS